MIRLIFVNAQNLKQVPNLDLELKKAHRIIKFKQDIWL